VTIADAAVLIGAGALAGLVSVVASLASLVSYPVLLALGLPPLTANMTNTVALVFTGPGAAAGSRPELAGQGGRAVRIGFLTALGGAAGGALLLLQPVLQRPAGQDRVNRSRPLLAAVFGVAVYIGYFGAAGGIMMVAVLAAIFDQSLARTNALKNVVSAAANAVAAVAFAVFGTVRWAFVLPLAAGFLIGGWAGPAIVRRLPGPVLRTIIGVAGLVIAVELGVAAYR